MDETRTQAGGPTGVTTGFTQAYQGFATGLYAAATAVERYPIDHPSRTQPLQRLANFIGAVHQRLPAVAIWTNDDGLLVVNDEPFYDPFPGSQEVLDRMRERGVSRIEVRRGVTGRELRALIAMMAMAPEHLEELGSARDYLEGQGVEHIVVELDDEDLETRAMELYTEAKEYIVDLWRETRLGNIPRGDKARDTMKQMTDLLYRDNDPNLLMRLTLLSQYDNYTFNHSVNVGIFAMAMGHSLGMAAEASALGLGGLLHDIGKSRIPKEIINKSGRLTDEEWALMRRHPEYSGEIVTQMGLPEAFDIAYQHHCGYNRAGYPSLPAGRDLSEGGLITAICDVYDSVTTLRPYQRQHTPQEGIQVLLRLKSGGHLHPRFTDRFIEMLGMYPIGTAVRLNTGEIALVSAVNREFEDRPRVRIVMDRTRNLLRIPIDLDLARDGAAGPGGRARRIVGTLDPAVLGIRQTDYLDPQKMQQGE